jgi:hypothetical protein
VKLSSWPEIGSDGDDLLTPYVPKGITGYDDDDDCSFIRQLQIVLKKHYSKHLPKSNAKLMAAKLTTHT